MGLGYYSHMNFLVGEAQCIIKKIGPFLWVWGEQKIVHRFLLSLGPN